VRLIVNGEFCETAAASVEDLVREQGADPARVAVVRNGELLPRGERAAAALRDGDRIELLTFATGG
jgi:sulfur carrier protein